MNIYFYSQYSIKESRKIFLSFKKINFIVFSNILKSKNNIFEDNDLKKIDYFILFIKNLDVRVMYITALAFLRKKKVIVLLPENIKVDMNWGYLINNSEFHFFNKNNLYEKVDKIISQLKQKTSDDLFNIKYTLRLSGKISDYLNWKADKINLSGADWLRQLIQEHMDNDPDYQNVLKDKYKLN